jgi:nitronate monooxygenase
LTPPPGTRQPVIVQGGMGVGVSAWPLARAVSRVGQLGVVSGTALDVVVARRLQLGDPGGHLRRALDHFPDRSIAAAILGRYFVEGGKPASNAFRTDPMHVMESSEQRQALSVIAGFVEVFLAKEGHAGVVGINFLEKIQLPTPATLYGAMLAGVDYVLVGAGIPREIPGVLDRLATHEVVAPRLYVAGATPEDDFRITFDPALVRSNDRQPLKRPQFLAIIASATLAITLVRKASGRVDGFIIEGPTAGGHNAPPRGPAERNARGEPVYGTKDEVDLDKVPRRSEWQRR